METLKSYISGAWVAGTGKMATLVNPTTEEPVAPEPASEHLRVLGARLTLRRSPTEVVLRAELPAHAFVR